jgi:hypothetical protein
MHPILKQPVRDLLEQVEDQKQVYKIMEASDCCAPLS